MNPFKLLGIIDSLLVPIQNAIKLVLPDFFEEKLDSPQVRNKIVTAADLALIKAAPESRLVPKNIRKRIIRRILDVLFDEIVLPD